MENRRRDLLLRLAKLRRGDMALWKLPPPSPPLFCSSSLSSSCLSSEVPHTRSRAPCKECRMLPTQPATCSWAAESFPPKYCMVEKFTQLVFEAPGSPWELGHRRNWGSALLEMKGFCWRVRKMGLCPHFQKVKRVQVTLFKKFLTSYKTRYSWSFIWTGSSLSLSIFLRFRQTSWNSLLFAVSKEVNSLTGHVFALWQYYSTAAFTMMDVTP